ncbi:hypothetical protein MMC07_004664 [Pseudocyphellaria aurata]|nr:hypothetical protein [Pseudocyphellaria aurata]
MNGNAPRHSSTSSNYDSRYVPGPAVQTQPSPRVLLEGYRGSLESSNGDHFRSNPSNQSYPRSSVLLNPDDPVSMHLLMESAIGDSQQYEVLSFEEVDELKNKLALLSSRIDATRRKLVLESKLRDAALSLNRLNPTNGRESMIGGAGNSPKRHRRSAMGSRSSNSELLSKTDDELATSTRKCEELAQELWRLEKQAQELQRRLLEHTAGILQMTHKGYLKSEIPPPSPDSAPEDLDGRQMPHILDGTHDFDDRSFYQTLDAMLDLGDGEKNRHSEFSSQNFVRHTQTILETERRLEDLNQRLRDSITLASTRSQQFPAPPVRQHKDEEVAGSVVQEQMDYLEQGLKVMQEDQSTVLHNAKRSAYAAEERLEDLNTQLHGMINRASEDANIQYPPPPDISGKSPEAQIGYLEKGLDTVEQSIQRLTDTSLVLSSRAATHEERRGEFETVLRDLWEIIAAAEEESRQEGQHQHDREPNNPVGNPPARDEFSLPTFSSKVQSLYAHAKGLQEQKEILGRQVQQQREVNSQSEAEKDAQVAKLAHELDQSKKSLETRDGEVKGSRDELLLVMGRLDTAQQEAKLREKQIEIDQQNALQAERTVRMETEERLYAELQTKEVELTKCEAQLQELKDDAGIANAEMVGKLDQSERKIHELTSQLNALKEELEHHQSSEATLKESVEQKTHEAEKSHLEMKNLEAEMVRLQTEVTVARAELDGAYGTRAQRAAEGATNPAIQKEIEDLTGKNSSLLVELAALKASHQHVGEGNAEMVQRVQVLQRELSETISEYEVMTKSSIEFEKEREHLEHTVDDLRDRCESLETELSDEKVRWLGVNPPGSSNGRDSLPPGSTSTMVLKNEFKKMMRETRAENSKALRFEQDERRKLEALVRSLKRDQTLGKSSLSQSMTAT